MEPAPTKAKVIDDHPPTPAKEPEAPVASAPEPKPVEPEPIAAPEPVAAAPEPTPEAAPESIPAPEETEEEEAKFAAAHSHLEGQGGHIAQETQHVCRNLRQGEGAEGNGEREREREGGGGTEPGGVTGEFACSHWDVGPHSTQRAVRLKHTESVSAHTSSAV